VEGASSPVVICFSLPVDDGFLADDKINPGLHLRALLSKMAQ
jgi:hypothetical protein